MSDWTNRDKCICGEINSRNCPVHCNADNIVVSNDSITIGNYVITAVHPDMVRIMKEDGTMAVTIGIGEFVRKIEEVLG